MAYLSQDALIVAGAGDCRAVLARAGGDGERKVVDLSTDHKVDSPDERGERFASFEYWVFVCSDPFAAVLLLTERSQISPWQGVLRPLGLSSHPVGAMMPMVATPLLESTRERMRAGEVRVSRCRGCSGIRMPRCVLPCPTSTRDTEAPI